MSWETWIELGQRAVEKLNAPRFDVLQGFVEQRENFKIVLEDGTIDDLDTGRISGLGISAVEQQNTNFFCFSSPDECAEELDAVRGLLGLSGPSEATIPWQTPEERTIHIERDINGRPEEHKRDRVETADRVARERDGRIRQVRVNYSEKRRRIAVVDREGWIHVEPQRYTNFRVEAIAEESGRREKGYGRLAGYAGEELFEEKSPSELARDAADQALTALEAQTVSAGPSTVVIGPGFGGTIFHEACGHGFEADHIFEGVSRFSGRMGEKVASDRVTFVDDGSLKHRYGGFRFDDEGVPSRRNVLIRDGVMESVMSDRKYARLLENEPSGNGRRQSFQHPALPRMTNTFIENGEADPDEIVADTEDGIYAKHIGGGQVDPASGDFIFSVTEGYRIEDGTVTHPIRDAALVGNGPEALNRIDAVGDDLELKPGVCGKGQWVPVCVGQPTLRVRRLTVGGGGE